MTQIEAVVQKWTLNTFKIWSCLKINYEKSNIIHLGKMDMIGVFMERILGCNKACFPIKYRGVPIRERKLKEDWT